MGTGICASERLGDDKALLARAFSTTMKASIAQIRALILLFLWLKCLGLNSNSNNGALPLLNKYIYHSKPLTPSVAYNLCVLRTEKYAFVSIDVPYTPVDF